MADIAFIGVEKMLGAGTSSNPYQIRTAAQLAQLATWVNAANTTYNDKYYIQTANISLSGYANWTPIGTSTNRFLGEYNGNGLQISSLTSTGTRNALFGYVTGTLKNIVVESGTVTGTTALSTCAGICVALTVSTSATLTGCINKASIVGVSSSGNCYLGGIVGYHGSNTAVSNCANFGNIVNNSTSSGLIYSGGIAGYCHTAETAIETCFNAGAVSGNGTLQAIAGYQGALTNCYFDNTVSGATEGGATGRVTADCKGADSLSNTAKLSGLGTTYWKPLTGYPVPVKTR